jgi:membrane protein implicated in regulation of membrane protease activity
MSRVLRGVRAFVMCWIDFIIGDDWTVAATVAIALLGTWGLTHAGVVAWWLLPLAVLAVTAVSLRRAVGREVREDSQSQPSLR